MVANGEYLVFLACSALSYAKQAHVAVIDAVGAADWIVIFGAHDLIALGGFATATGALVTLGDNFLIKGPITV